jgi:acetylornithine deacetylase/succinyl-diaminopimelate desuccinylase-like protein
LSSRSHSPNEYMRIDSLDKTIKCIAIILEKFAGTNTNVFKNKSVL